MLRSETSSDVFFISFSMTNSLSLLPPWSRLAVLLAASLLVLAGTGLTTAQTEDAFGDSAADPVKLFERGQNAHARGIAGPDVAELAKALELYDEAIKVKPDFAEAEFQRANVLIALDRLPEAEAGFRQVLALRKEWSLPYAALGALLVRLERDAEAEPLLRQALKLDPENSLAQRLLADVRLRAGDAKEALVLLRHATSETDAPLSAWLLRARAERATNDDVAALSSLGHVMQVEPRNAVALLERAEIRIANGDNEPALADLAAAEALLPGEKASASRLAADYELAGKPEAAQRIAQAAGLSKAGGESGKASLQVIGTPEEIEAANSDDVVVARKALEVLLGKNPKNAMLCARLGSSYRTVDAVRSLRYYQSATEMEPANPDYATGYSAALIQARRFAEAAQVLRRVIAAAPENYPAHANLATALYELKQFAAALAEYHWLLQAKPDLTVAYYFIATAHDYLGEYEDALAAYETFLARADIKTNQLEIEKVNLRLPTLRRQIKLGQGIKRKTDNPTRP
jgi:tetratricopeptide (TPR) repeat protein